MIKDEEHTMELKDILVVALASLLVLVITHIAVFWVVRSLYPPVVVPVQPVFTPAAVPYQEPQQNVTLPTYEAPVPTQAPREEGPERTGPPPPEATSIHGNARVDPAHPQ